MRYLTFANDGWTQKICFITPQGKSEYFIIDLQVLKFIECQQRDLKIASDKLHHRNMQIKESKNIIKILGEGLNAIRDTFYDTKQNPQVFIGNVETILNATKNKL